MCSSVNFFLYVIKFWFSLIQLASLIKYKYLLNGFWLQVKITQTGAQQRQHLKLSTSAVRGATLKSIMFSWHAMIGKVSYSVKF